jgi:hypothetical protein
MPVDFATSFFSEIMYNNNLEKTDEKLRKKVNLLNSYSYDDEHGIIEKAQMMVEKSKSVLVHNMNGEGIRNLSF